MEVKISWSAESHIQARSKPGRSLVAYGVDGKGGRIDVCGIFDDTDAEKLSKFFVDTVLKRVEPAKAFSDAFEEGKTDEIGV
tara:strand:- start:36117 stop:36362 length:246 start_codon:yes stop_codon:yes gene_type:complete